MPMKRVVRFAIATVALVGLLTIHPLPAQGGMQSPAGQKKTTSKGGNTNTNTNNKNNNNNNNTPAPPPNPEIALTKAEIVTDQDALSTLVKKLTSDFKDSDAYVAAQKSVADFSAAYEQAKIPVLEALPGKNPTYKKDKALADAAQAKLDKLKAANGDPRSISDASQAVFDLGNVIGPIEQKAIEADPVAAEAKSKLDAAIAIVNKMLNDFMVNMKLNPDYVAAKKALDDATAKLATLK